jgi:transposase
MSQTLAAGGAVWIGDETALRAFPPVRAARTKRGVQPQVFISGRNAHRVIWGALNVHSGELVRVGRPRARKEDAPAVGATLGQWRPDVAKLRVWDNAPPQQPTLVRQAAAAAAAGITRTFLPFRAPELNSCEDRWRQLTGVVAANRAYATVEDLLDRALAWLDTLTPSAVLRRSSLASSKFNWLPT